jgi:hypothetical protein
LSEPVITINGRTLVPAQAKAVRGALLLANGAIDSIYDADRLTEVLAIMAADQSAPKTGTGIGRLNRILQLAGIVPEQATMEQILLADGYAAAGIMVDEAATRLRRALESR